MTTTFQLVSEMNEAFQNPKGDPLNINWTKIQKQCLNIPDEIGELFKAMGGHAKDTVGAGFIDAAVEEFKKRLADSLEIDSEGDIDVDGVRDALCDIPVFSCGAQHLMGVNGDHDMEVVIGGVMTRFIKDDADKEATIAKHASKGVTEVYFEGSYPKMIMKSAKDQPDAPQGKFLKSASYQEPVFYGLGTVPSDGKGLNDLADLIRSFVWDGAYDVRKVSTIILNEDIHGDPSMIEITVTGNNYEEAEEENDESDELCYECDQPHEDCECEEDSEGDFE